MSDIKHCAFRDQLNDHLARYISRVGPDIDIAYILQGALDFQERIERIVPSSINKIRYDPKASRRRRIEGALRPEFPLLIVDDSYWGGDTFRGAVEDFVEAGYSRGSISGLFVFGENIPFAADNTKFMVPVLDSADNIATTLPLNRENALMTNWEESGLNP